MPSLTEWKVPPANQPRPGDYGFDLDRALASVVSFHSIIPADAFSAETLGTEHAGNGVLINVLRDEQPTHLAVAFDVSPKTFRSAALLRLQGQPIQVAG